MGGGRRPPEAKREVETLVNARVLRREVCIVSLVLIIKSFVVPANK